MKDFYKKIKGSIKGFTKNPMGNLAFLIPIVMVLVSFTNGIVTYIKFIVAGGYVTQVDYVKKEGFLESIEERFTKGTTSAINEGIVSKIILALVITEIILIIISYFREGGIVKNVLMSISLVILAIQGVLTKTVFWKVVSPMFYSEAAFYIELYNFKGISDDPISDLITYGLITIITFFVFIILILIGSDSSEIFKFMLKSLGIIYFLIPLGFVLLQNIVTLFASALGLVVVGGLIFFGFYILAGAPCGNSNYECSGDIIYTRNKYGDKVPVCTVKEYEKGEKVIIDKGERVMDVGWCKKPKK